MWAHGGSISGDLFVSLIYREQNIFSCPELAFTKVDKQ
jgi:hypothetical protein